MFKAMIKESEEVDGEESLRCIYAYIQHTVAYSTTNSQHRTRKYRAMMLLACSHVVDLTSALK